LKTVENNRPDFLSKDIPMLDASAEDFHEQLAFALWSTGGSCDYSNDRNRPYNGQAHTIHGERGKTEIKGVTARDVMDCFVKGLLLSSGCPDMPEWIEIYNDPEKKKAAQERYPYYKIELNTWRYNDIYKVDLNKVDPGAWIRNTIIEIENMMTNGK
jgi:hypothetical protein